MREERREEDKLRQRQKELKKGVKHKDYDEIIPIICSSSTNKMYTTTSKLFYINNYLLHVSAKHLTLFREVKYKG
jgi:hypothetical protein